MIRVLVLTSLVTVSVCQLTSSCTTCTSNSNYGSTSQSSSYNTNSVQQDSTGSSSSNQPGYLPDYQGDRYTDPQRIAETQALNKAFFDSIGGAPSPPPETPAQQGMNGTSGTSASGQYSQQQYSQQQYSQQQYNQQQYNQPQYSQQQYSQQQYSQQPQQQTQYGSTTSYSTNGQALYQTGTTNYPTLYQQSSPQYSNGCTNCRFRRHFRLGPVKF